MVFLNFIDEKKHLKRLLPSVKQKEVILKMGKVIVKKAITRKPGFLYYVDGNGNVCEAKLARGGRKKVAKKKVAKKVVKKPAKKVVKKKVVKKVTKKKVAKKPAKKVVKKKK